jgi:hypothetical protein
MKNIYKMPTKRYNQVKNIFILLLNKSLEVLGEVQHHLCNRVVLFLYSGRIN